jgi:hypothetical protein
MRRALSLTSWFYHPDVAGMTDYEVLSRASAFAVTSSSRAQPRLHIVASQHVTHPFRYGRYYPAERYPFVHALSEDHVRCTLESRRPSGETERQLRLRRRMRTHPDRDLALGQLLESDAPQFEGLGLEPLVLDDRPLREGEPLAFVGHVVREDASSAAAAAAGGAASTEGQPRPHSVAGTFVARSPAHQCFARTEELLEIGMCGGPVLDEAGRCVGVIEGVVPQPATAAELDGRRQADESPRERTARLLGGCAVFIGAEEVARLVAAAEGSPG